MQNLHLRGAVRSLWTNSTGSASAPAVKPVRPSRPSTCVVLVAEQPAKKTSNPSAAAAVICVQFITEIIPGP